MSERITTDDKGRALAALYGALAARRAGVPLNVRFLWELEEESGSVHFGSAIRKLAPRLATDLVVISDGLWVSRRRPTCLSALRGWLGLELALETGLGDAHSGIVGGLARTEDSEEAMRRIWALPTFEVHGVVGGYTGPGLKSIVPGRAEVKASFRLAPGQRPERVATLVKRFIRKRNRDVVVRCDAGAMPYRADVSGPLAAALRRAMADAFGKEPTFVRGGGTIGAVATMERVLGAPVLFLDLSLPEHGYHAANEYFEWRQASRGMVAFARFFGELAGPDGALAGARSSHGATRRLRRVAR